jgi:hypothetical protein
MTCFSVGIPFFLDFFAKIIKTTLQVVAKNGFFARRNATAQRNATQLRGVLHACVLLTTATVCRFQTEICFALFGIPRVLADQRGTEFSCVCCGIAFLHEECTPETRALFCNPACSANIVSKHCSLQCLFKALVVPH